jgi:DNA polymerase IV (DinB-like DNA polymerase)
MIQYILHCDLDCFFAAVEMRDNPDLKGKPVIIGADPKEGKGRGVVATCSYEAREFGLHSAMPISKAYNLCPHGIYLRPSHEKYSKTSKKVMSILRSYANSFQQVSVDEAYLDVTETCNNFKDAAILAKKIKSEISQEIGITVSIGVANTKSIAKIASDFNKPNGITLVKPEYLKDFLCKMDITRIPGIGKKTKQYYYRKGIRKIGDLLDLSCQEMIKLFGKNGKWVWKVINGLDNRKVKEFHEGRKSISKERTFYEDTNDFDKILEKIEDLNVKIHKWLVKSHISYKTITLKIRFEDFETFTRSKSVDFPVCNPNTALKIILELYKEFSDLEKKVRLIGIKFSNFQRNKNIIQTSILTFVKN